MLSLGGFPGVSIKSYGNTFLCISTGLHVQGHWTSSHEEKMIDEDYVWKKRETDFFPSKSTPSNGNAANAN